MSDVKDWPDWAAIYKTLDWSPPLENPGGEEGWVTTAILPDGRRLSVYYHQEVGFFALAADLPTAPNSSVHRWRTVPPQAVRLLQSVSGESSLVAQLREALRNLANATVSKHWDYTEKEKEAIAHAANHARFVLGDAAMGSAPQEGPPT